MSITVTQPSRPLRENPHDDALSSALVRLCVEFDTIPLRKVFRAFGAARLQLRDQSGDATEASAVEQLARTMLETESTAAPTFNRPLVMAA